MDDIYVQMDFKKSVPSRPSVDHTGPRSPEKRFLGAAVLFLGLLTVFLVAALIGLGVHYRNLLHGAAGLVTSKANLTELLQASNDKLSSVTGERDQLNSSLTDLTEELNRLQKLSTQKKTCPKGWKQFQCSCYHLSGQTGSWVKGREDCRKSDADLVVINSAEEQTFVTEFSKVATWIGLSDRDKEGTWQWVDRSPLTVKYWAACQPDNGNGNTELGEEDCVHIKEDGMDNWNDLSCEVSLLWICEKTRS